MSQSRASSATGGSRGHEKARKRYAVVGTGSRCDMFVSALATTYREVTEIVAFCDLSQTRMDWYQARVQGLGGGPVATYLAERFDDLVAETKPDVVIVTTIDSTHHHYIVRALELGCDVITEKPLTVDVPKMKAILEATERTGRSLKVTFNYRYAPAFSRFKALLAEGHIGRPLAVDFAWLLDTRHGADYFRRWHREKEHSGGLLVHKATHHFDLVNWWLGSYPQSVMAMGDLLFYGRANAEARGESYPYARYTGVPEAADDPFGLFLDQKPVFQGLYLDAEAETGYLRDRNVFGEPITIEDTLRVIARYRNGALLSYSLLAYSPWEGLRVAVTGSKGRLELEIVESINHLDGALPERGTAHNKTPQSETSQSEPEGAGASKGSYQSATLRLHPMFGDARNIAVPVGDGGHGGADPVMLEQLFAPDPPNDPLDRAASHIDGAASILLGIAANTSVATGCAVAVDDLWKLPDANARTKAEKTGSW
jgi:predicted dehydrogenase